MTFTVAIVGRPNVGKSTLFNRLVGRREALVDPEPGVTRDRREGTGRIGPLGFRVIDTAGLDEADPGSLGARMRDQTDRALAEADALLFVVDARSGLTPQDGGFARELRKWGLPVVPVANKAEAAAARPGVLEAFDLGLGEPVAISAEHGMGLGELYRALAALAPADAAGDGGRGALRLAFVGRPNVGKSTLVNRLLGEQRVICGPEACLTRDSIAARFEFAGREIDLVDTAGLRRRARVTEHLEKLAAGGSLEAIRLAHAVAVVIDATQAFDRQDLAIADLVAREGKVPVLVLNKWDRVENGPALRGHYRERVRALLPQVRGVPLVTLSALHGTDVPRLMPAVAAAHDRWCVRLPTSRLNRWLESVRENHPPPVSRGGRIKLRFVAQTGSRPPVFTLHGTRVRALPAAYKRYLVNRLRDDFDVGGIPLRLRFKATDNPYVAPGG